MPLLKILQTRQPYRIVRSLRRHATACCGVFALLCVSHAQAQIPKSLDLAKNAGTGEVHHYLEARDDDRLADVFGAAEPTRLAPAGSFEIDFAIIEAESPYSFGETATNMYVVCSGILFDSIKPRIDLTCETAPTGSGESALQYWVGCEFGSERIAASAGLTGTEPLTGGRLQQSLRALQAGLNWRVSPDLVVTADVQFPLDATSSSGPIVALQAVHLF